MPLLDYVLVQKYLQNVDPLIWRVILRVFSVLFVCNTFFKTP